MSAPRCEQLSDNVAVWLGDCLEVLPGLDPVDHVFGDPPYEDELHKAIGRIRRNDGQKMISTLGFDGVNDSRTDIARVCVEASMGWVILFTLAEGVRAWRDELQAAGAKWDTTCFWVKPDSAPRFNGQGPARGAECFVTCWAGKGYRKWNGGGKRGIYTHCVNTNRQGEHPTEKPLPLMSEIISDFTQRGQLICDPFCGSGSTGISCVDLGRRFVGIERDPKWFDLSCRRISETLRRPRLPFDEPKPQPVQEALPL
jgi:site-specific DNA-methyltransferase (adenine-specific)